MAAPGVSPAEVRSVLRALLRAVDKHLTPVSKNKQWRQEALSQFRKPLGQGEGCSTAGATEVASAGPGSAATGSGAFGSKTPARGEGGAAGPGQSLSAKEALAVAQDWTFIINNIARHKELLLSYNIGIDADERSKRMVEATARRMGFSLPKAS